MSEEEIKKFLERILVNYDAGKLGPSEFWAGARAAVEFILGEDDDPTDE